MRGEMQTMKLLRYKLLLPTILALATVSASAQVDWKALDVGNLSSAIFNTTAVGYPQDVTGIPSGWWPAGTNDSYIYEGDIWIGAKKGGEIGVSAAGVRHSEIWPIDDGPGVVSDKPGMTTKGTPTSQSIFFKCSDTNPEAN